MNNRVGHIITPLSSAVMNISFCQICASDTWSLTLAVSRGNVTMSAIQAAAPALAIFTPSGGGTSEGFSPTIVYKYWRGVLNRRTDKDTCMKTPAELLIYCLMTVSSMSRCLRWWYKTYLRRACVCEWAQFKGSLRSLLVCCRAGFDYNPYRAPAAGKGKMLLLLCVYISVAGFFFLWHPPRGVSVYSWTHRSNQSPLTVRKSMFNSLPPSPHPPKNNCFTSLCHHRNVNIFTNTWSKV